MQVNQIRLSKMETFAYIVGDESSGTCALIDPAFDTGRILDKAAAGSFIVTHVINTHGHSDHTAGNTEIISATGAKLLIHADDAGKLAHILNRSFSRLLGGKGSSKPDLLLKDDDKIQIGETVLTVLHTPGHTPGSICLYCEGHLFTGDTLFVGAVGRTDLPGGSMKKLLHSIHRKLYGLPGETQVWPGHDYGVTPVSTIEQEKNTNPYTR